MATYVTVSEARLRLDQVLPGPVEDARIQEFLDGAEAIVLRQLIGVTIPTPAPDDLTEIIYQLATTLYLTRDSASRMGTVGALGQGGFEFAGGLVPQQKAALSQIRWDLGGQAV